VQRVCLILGAEDLLQIRLEIGQRQFPPPDAKQGLIVTSAGIWG